MPTQSKKLEAGQEVLAQCKKCKSDTPHVITVLKNDKISKVMCKSCLSTHAYRPPETEEPAKGSRKTKQATNGEQKKVRRRRRKLDWPSLMAKIEESDIVDYDINGDFTETQAIRHKTFGVGVIIKVLAENKIEVVFQQDKKILAQNWQQ